MKKLKFKTLTRIAIIGIFLAVLSVLIYKITEDQPQWVDKYYSQGIFNIINFPGKLFVAIFPFSIGEILLIAGIISLLTYTIITIIGILKKIFKRSNPSFVPLVKYLLIWVSIVSYTLTFFIIFGGLNYNRSTFSSISGLEIKAAPVEELEQLCTYLGKMAGEARIMLQKDSSGVVCSDISVNHLLKNAKEGYDALKNKYSFFDGTYPIPKKVLLSRIMCYEGITGIYPYILPEPLINYETPIFELPHTICHEQAHQRGFAREDEANYISYLACINNPEPIYKYSGYYSALVYSINALNKHSPEAFQRCKKAMDPGIFLDINASYKFWMQFEGPVQNASTAINNTFLQVNNQVDGVYSYGRMVDLLLAEQRNR